MKGTKPISFKEIQAMNTAKRKVGRPRKTDEEKNTKTVTVRWGIYRMLMFLRTHHRMDLPDLFDHVLSKHIQQEYRKALAEENLV